MKTKEGGSHKVKTETVMQNINHQSHPVNEGLLPSILLLIR